MQSSVAAWSTRSLGLRTVIGGIAGRRALPDRGRGAREVPGRGRLPSRPTASPGERPATCAYSCVIDVGQETTDCNVATATVVFDGDNRGRASIDASGFRGVELEIEICDPSDWVFNVGDSISNNGGGGDGGDSSHDSELFIQDTTLSIFASDSSANTVPVRSENGYVSATGCTTRVVRIRDGPLRK